MWVLSEDIFWSEMELIFHKASDWHQAQARILSSFSISPHCSSVQRDAALTSQMHCSHQSGKEAFYNPIA